PAKSNIESGRLFIDPRLGYGEFACVRYKDIPLVQGKIPGEHPVYHFGPGPNFKVFFGQNGLEIENISVWGYKLIWKPQEREFSLISKGLDGEDVPEKDFDFQRGECQLNSQREISFRCRPRSKVDICASPLSQSFYNSIMLVFFPLLLTLYLFRLNTSPPDIILYILLSRQTYPKIPILLIYTISSPCESLRIKCSVPGILPGIPEFSSPIDDKYFSVVTGSTWTYGGRLNFVIDWLEDNLLLPVKELPSCAVLDIGASTGETTVDLANRLYKLNPLIHVYGIDPGNHLGSNIRVKPSNLTFIQDDHRLRNARSLIKEPIKIILSFNVFINHYISQEAKQAVERMEDYLEEDGIILIGYGGVKTFEPLLWFLVSQKENKKLIPRQLITNQFTVINRPRPFLSWLNFIPDKDVSDSFRDELRLLDAKFLKVLFRGRGPQAKALRKAGAHCREFKSGSIFTFENKQPRRIELNRPILCIWAKIQSFLTSSPIKLKNVYLWSKRGVSSSVCISYVSLEEVNELLGLGCKVEVFNVGKFSISQSKKYPDKAMFGNVPEKDWLEKFPEYENNSVIIYINALHIALKGVKKNILIDPGYDAKKLITALENKGIKLEKIGNNTVVICTHPHFDHTGALMHQREPTLPGVRIYLNNTALHKLSEEDSIFLKTMNRIRETNPDFIFDKGDFRVPEVRAIFEKDNLLKYITGGGKLIPGIGCIEAQVTGVHSPGHWTLRVGLGSKKLIIPGDELSNEIWAKFLDLATTNPKAIRLIKKILQEAYNTGSYIFLFHNPHDSCFIKVEKCPSAASPLKNSIIKLLPLSRPRLR
ncbi:MAG: MBL fold metallo-hydrolase, partial [Candidatus Omnitrophota bacterium]